MNRFFTSWKFTYALAFALLVGMFALRADDPSPLKILRNKTFDVMQRVWPREPPPEGYPINVRIIDLDDESLEAIGQWPWPRTRVAELVRILVDDYHVAAVAFDIVFAEPDRTAPAQLVESLEDITPEIRAALLRLPDNDQVLAETIAGRPVILGQATIPRGDPPAEGDIPRVVGFGIKNNTPGDEGQPRNHLLNFRNIERNLPELEANAPGIGMFSFSPDEDNIVRRVPLVVAVNGELYPALSVESLRVVLERLQGTRLSLFFQYGSEGARSVAFQGSQFSLPTDASGHAWVYYAPYTRDRYVSAKDVMDHSADPALLVNTIVILGTSAAGLQDIRATPLSEGLPGVEVHAQILENILSNVFLTRDQYAPMIELAAIIVAGLAIMVVLPLGGALWSLFAVILVNAGLMGFSYYQFREEYRLVGFVYPLLCSVLLYTFLTMMNYMREEQAKKQVRGAFAQYLSPAMVEELASNPERLKLGGEMRNMTLLFSDIRGFTAISEQFRGNAVGLVSLINRFLTPMTGIILDRKGTIDKYMGDCIMAFWNAPLLDDEQVDHSIDAALAMTEEVERINVIIEAEAKAEGRRFFPIKVGVGINTGEVFVGNMGSDQRFDYSVIGDDVNLASRLEGQSKTYGVIIVIGPNTHAVAADLYATLELDKIQVKGRQEAVTIYTVLGRKDMLSDPAYIAFKAKHDAMLVAYRSQDWDLAESLLAECRQMWPSLHGLHDLYAERIAEFRINPPGADWDGVYVATSK
ncbi:MAG: adenylate/guanylate cyclase domain-containing protein [Proteobacteria bacterium]|nr:adenylate/guanylate cyclase domain-containing protein [Pseudomonadota bacterium]